MNFSKEYPPNYEKLKARFPALEKNTRVVFTYGDTIYAPHAGQLDPNLIAHEETHYWQQVEMGAEAWWNRYLSDDLFRFEQEVQAYRAQYRHLQEHSPRDYRRKVLKQLSKDLSSEIYGNLISRARAEEFIRGED